MELDPGPCRPAVRVRAALALAVEVVDAPVGDVDLGAVDEDDVIAPEDLQQPPQLQRRALPERLPDPPAPAGAEQLPEEPPRGPDGLRGVNLLVDALLGHLQMLGQARPSL